MTVKTYYGDELYHFGVKGMKWGVRRYQNFDGTYTQAGLKRYRRSLESYEKRKEQYKTLKNDRNASHYSKQYAKSKMKEAERQLKKDYKHLALDKKADKGKNLYAKGYRITNSGDITRTIAQLGAGVAFGAEYARRAGYIDAQTARTAQYVSIGATAVSGIKSLLDEIPNSRLRAYYSHTSNY